MYSGKRKTLAIVSTVGIVGLCGLSLWYRAFLHEQALNRALVSAIIANDASRVHALLENGADANARSGSAGSTGILQKLRDFIAAIRHGPANNKRGSPIVVRLFMAPFQTMQLNVTLLVPRPANHAILADLLRHGAAVNAADDSGNTALLDAAAVSDLESCRLLLENGANPNIYPLVNSAPLVELITNSWQRESKKTAVALLMLQHGATVNIRNSIGETPLANAIGGADIELAAELIRRGANPNTQDNDGNTPLMNLIHAGYLYDSVKSPVVKFILNNGADVNLQNRAGDSPVSYAVIAGDVNLLHALLDRGANPNTRNSHGLSPYGIAAGAIGGRFEFEKRTEMLGLLAAHGANP